ncbi:MAG: peptidoglycan DD-metalloendopeptidase family protein [Tannerella sp.]|jgi:septal ring factor EnvC (AmiA/AmiB activator)|nr:peptidoglycan DD-metalloendopeptidase family protein [Tannerella sp.]
MKMANRRLFCHCEVPLRSKPVKPGIPDCVCHASLAAGIASQPYNDGKPHFWNRPSFAFVCMLLYFLLFLCTTAPLISQNTRDLESQRKAKMEEIELTTRLLNEIRSSARTSLNRLTLLSAQVESRKKVINLLNQEISAIDHDITAMQRELVIMEKDLKDFRERYAESVQKLYTRRTSQYKWLFVLSAHNFSQIVRRMRYIREYADWQKRRGFLIIKKQEELNRKQMDLEKSRSEKVALLSDREEEIKQLGKEEGNYRTEVRELNRRQREVQAELDRQRRQATELNRQIERIIAGDQSRADRDSGSRKAESSGGYRMTPQEQKLAGEFASNRGKLPFPLSGKYKIVRPYGEYQHPQYKNVRLKSNGIDIQTESGTEARAVFNGVVRGIFMVPGSNYHNIILRHGNYLTVYSKLSEVFVKNGESVSTSQRLGRIFTDTKNDHATILTFEIRKEKDTLNPEVWLQ